jgi:hypothetical protein
MHEKSLADVIEGFGEDARPTLTVGEMLEAFDSRAFGAMLLVFGAAEHPAAAAGLLDPAQSLPILLLAPQIAMGADTPWLPRALMDKPLKRDDLRGLFRKLGPIVRSMELITRRACDRCSHPWASGRSAWSAPCWPWCWSCPSRWATWRPARRSRFWP